MGLYRSPDGSVEEIPDDSSYAAIASGYVPITGAQAGAPVESSATGGALGVIGTGASSVLSGATLGLSDIALSHILSRGDVARIRADRAEHPIVSGAGQVAGMVLPALLSGGAITPAGALSRATLPLVERGGVSAILGGGIEGAAQNVGAYLADTALGDRDLSAEGLASSLGTGFVFGGAGGAAALGIEKGTIAARRMFSRLVDGSDAAADVATQAWKTQYQSTLDAHNAALDIAKAELAKARAAREFIGLARDQASADLARINALAPEIDAAHAAATGLDEKIAAIEAMDKPAITGGYEDLQRLVSNHEANKSELENVISRIESPVKEQQNPLGFDPSLKVSGNRIFNENPNITEGIPNSVNRSSYKDNAYIVRPSELSDRGVLGIRSGPDMISDERTSNVLNTWKDEKSVPAVEIDVDPKGRYFIADGNHRVLAAAIDGDRPILARFRPIESDLANEESLVGDIKRALGSEDRGTLLDLLHGTKQRLDSGESIASIGESSGRKSAFVERPITARTALERQARSLEIAKDAAIERVANATNDIERAAANSDLKIINAHIASMGRMPNAVDDVHAIADAITKYEKSGTELVEGMGDLAPPLAHEHAAAFRAAEDAADRKMVDRTTRAIDDHVDPQPVGVDRRPSANPPAKVKIKDAKQALRTSQADYQQARVAETQAKMRVREVAGQRPKAPAVPPTKPSTLGAVLMTAELASDIGIPGIPKPHDIPIIGPLLSAYLKYRVMKAAIGRFTGRVAATGDTHAATMVAKTKEKIAHAIDRTLGLVASNAPKARCAIVATSTVLGRRLFDDGEPDAPRGASSQDQAAVRIREILAANQRPELIQAQVRREMRNVIDPDLIAAVEKHLIARFAHLSDVVPKPPDDNDYAQRKWKPSMDATHELKQRLAVIQDPEHALSGPMSPAAADTFRTLYPQLYALAKQRLMARVGDLSAPMSYANRLRASMLFQMPVDASMDPQHIAIVRATDEAPPPELSQPESPTAQVPAPNLSSMYNPANTRVR